MRIGAVPTGDGATSCKGLGSMRLLSVRSAGKIAALSLVSAGLSVIPSAGHALATSQIVGQPTVATTVSTLVGSGVEVSDSRRSGGPGQFATFDTGSSSLDVGFSKGLIMSTGRATAAAGPNTLDYYNQANASQATSTRLGGPGDPAVAAAAQGAATTAPRTADAAVLEFSFVPAGDRITFNYVFASEEYPEYVGATYNDAFAFLVNGVSCARVPGGTDPVSIRTVNRTKNQSQFRDNALYAAGSTNRRSPAVAVAYDGLTKVFSCTAPVTKGKTNTVKLAIADVADESYDSAVFLQANSFTPYTNSPPVVTVPSDMSVEAAGAAGSPVSYTASATDDHDGDLTPTCTPPSGSTFPLGTTGVTCRATDSRGLSSDGGFDVVVADTRAPVLVVPDDQTVEATGPGGAPVTFETTASDVVDGERPVTCDHDSGDTFPLGDTEVTCSSEDEAGNEVVGSFTATVADTTGPALTMPADRTIEAAGPDGAVAEFVVSADDLVDGVVAPVCTATSGSTFALGGTGVQCTATDRAGNQSIGIFTITVVDTTSPRLTLPEDRTIEATGPDGAVNTFEVSAADAVDGAVTPSCSPESGTSLPFGATDVTCTAADKAGNTSRDSFTVTVVDTTGPSLELPANVTATLTGASGGTASWTATATDLVDGATAVVCDHASGTSFPAGSTVVTCSSTDSRGNESTGSFEVTVAYGWLGFAQPINDTGHTQTDHSVFKAGSTVPVKFSLYAGGTATRAATAPVWVTPQAGAPTTAPVDETVYTMPGSTGTTFTYDGAGRYQYNWATTKSMAGKYWRIGVRLDDGTTKYVVIALR